jgi:WD40 repeat protein
LKGHAYPITSLAYSPDRKWFVSDGVDNIGFVWDGENGDRLSVLDGLTDVDEVLTMSSHPGTAVGAVFSSDGSEIA